MSNAQLLVWRTVGAQKNCAQTGASLVEFAFVLPVFLTLTLGTILYGLAWFTQESLQRVAREVTNSVLVVDPRMSDARSEVALLAGQTLKARTSKRFSPSALLPLSVVTVSSGDVVRNDGSLCGRTSSNQLCIIRSAADNAISQVVLTLQPKLATLRPGLPAIALVPLPERVFARSVVFFDR